MVTISKFFAELGFKVNSSEFKQVESTLKQINTAYKQLAQGIKLETAELKKQLVQQKINTEAEKTATQASKAQRAAIDAETSAIRKQTAQLNLHNKQNRARLSIMARIMPFLSLYGMASGIRATAQQGLRYRDFQRQTGMDVGGLQKYEAASQIVGSSLSSEQVTGEIKELQQRMQAIQYARGDVTPFQIWGLQTQGNTAYDIIEGLRERIKGLDDASSLYWIRQIGLSDDWLHILRQSKEEFDSIQAAMLSKEQIRSVSNIGLSLRRVQFALKQLRDQAVAFASSSLGGLLTSFSEMATETATFLKSLSGSREAFAVFASGVALIMAKLSPLTTILTTALLLLEDYWVATQGGKSMFGWGQGGSDTGGSAPSKGKKKTISILGMPVAEYNSSEESFGKRIWNNIKEVFSGGLSNLLMGSANATDLTSPSSLTSNIAPKAENITINAPSTVNATVHVDNTEDAVDYTKHLRNIDSAYSRINEIDERLAMLRAVKSVDGE